jgi:Ni/Co efflux regulator RcnB
MIMKYFVAMCLLAAPLAMSVATPAEAGFRDHVRCHWVRKTTWRHGHKHTRWVKACRERDAANYRHTRYR